MKAGTSRVENGNGLGHSKKPWFPLGFQGFSREINAFFYKIAANANVGDN